AGIRRNRGGPPPPCRTGTTCPHHPLQRGGPIVPRRIARPRSFMSGSHFLDTNVLLYSISTDPEEASKRAIAIDLLDREGGALSVQVLQEFYVQATRTKREDALPHDVAAGLIETWMRFAVQ